VARGMPAQNNAKVERSGVGGAAIGLRYWREVTKQDSGVLEVPGFQRFPGASKFQRFSVF